MITVTRPGRYDTAEYLYNRNKNATVLSVELKTDSMQVSHEISVPEAKALAKELLEWAREFEGDEEADQ